MASFATKAGLGILGAYLGGAMLGRRQPPRRTVPERLGDLPRRGLPLKAPVTIHWDDHQIPYIEAAHDQDLAVALGVVHGHLRLAQIETMRRAARGRLAEVVGPAAAELDHLLRLMDLPRAVPAIAAALPEETRRWMEGFAAGLTAAARGPLPYEFELLGIRPEPWTVEDLLALGRLAATDFTWKVWIPLLRLRARADWPVLWERMMRDNALPVPGFAGAAGLLSLFTRQGSNSFAVSARRSAGGSALLASDPHLSLVLPNLWLVAGMASPSFNAVGLMIPGVPAVALGRNRWIGWGGTSLHAQSSELFEVSDLPASDITEREETIRVRWQGERRVTLRDTAWGPIITDAPMLGTAGGRRLALHWIGHRPSDEVTALLAVNRARNWEEFRTALAGFAVPAQNMIYADAEGRVGQCMAAVLPWRPLVPPDDLFVPREHRLHWERLATGNDLPARFDPTEGFVASANNRPEGVPDLPVGFFFSPEDRIRRLRDRLSGKTPITRADLEDLQRDVFVPSALDLRDRLLALTPRTGDLVGALAAWDGRYDADSEGAAAFELLLFHFVVTLRGAEGLDVCTAGWEPWAFVRDDLDHREPVRVGAALRTALVKAEAAFARHPRWGDLHRLRLSHPLGALPVLGRRFRFTDEPTAGSNETVMKTAHGFAGARHAAKLGANARHLSDMADPDANGFVLLGGQDGWIGSTTFLDQLSLWRAGAYVRVPLRPEAARSLFRHKTELTP